VVAAVPWQYALPYTTGSHITVISVVFGYGNMLTTRELQRSILELASVATAMVP
jgi:hypothetical protein